MCLARAVCVQGEKEIPVCAYVSRFSAKDDQITLTDVMGEEVTVAGRILHVDLVKNLIVISPS